MKTANGKYPITNTQYPITKCGFPNRKSVPHDSAVRYSIFDIRRLFVFSGLATVLFALPGCGLMPEKSYLVPNTTIVLPYPDGWTVSRDTDHYGLITVFSPDARPGPRSTRITLQAGTITAEPRPGRGLVATAPIQGQSQDAGYVQWHNYIQRGALNPESLHGAILYQDLGLSPEGLRGYRIVVPPQWAIEVYAPPGDFATIRSTAERMAQALKAADKPGAQTPGRIK
jgi:hypothetical protein